MDNPDCCKPTRSVRWRCSKQIDADGSGELDHDEMGELVRRMGMGDQLDDDPQFLEV